MLESMFSKGKSHRPFNGTCSENSIRAAQRKFFYLVIVVVVICLCVHNRLFNDRAPVQVRRPYSVPKTFITSECGDERRLGNSMFAYASLLGIAHHNNMTPVIEEGIRLTQVFNISALMTKDMDNTMGIYQTYEEYGKRGCAFDRSLLRLNSRYNVKLLGYLQSWQYFIPIEAIIRSNFDFKGEIKEKATRFLSISVPHSMKDKEIVRVGIHVRRGDMTEGYYMHYGYITAPSDYFRKAMNYFKSRYDNVHFIVCSDDMTWAKENLATSDDSISFSVGNTEAVDLAILSRCDHVIVSVGSFGWWAAWLANGSTVYYNKWPRPSSMLEYVVDKKDYFPAHWIPLE